jgi:hypothetical protein
MKQCSGLWLATANLYNLSELDSGLKGNHAWGTVASQADA